MMPILNEKSLIQFLKDKYFQGKDLAMIYSSDPKR